MARATAGQVSARRWIVARRRMVAAALIVGALIVLRPITEVYRSAAQSAPAGAAQQQAPFSPFAPYPSPAPYQSSPLSPAQVERPTTRPMERVRTKRHVVRPHATRRKVVEKKESRRKPNVNQREIAESKGYKRVSDLVNFPKFFPGLGIIFVKPDTLPTGPFLCFDREDHLVATVYMIPIKDIDDHRTIDAAGVTAPVDHVSFYFNPGHPGVDVPHYHFVIWHVPKKDEARVAQ